MKIVTKPFDALTLDELYAILRLRQEVFILEQNCFYLDQDGYDQVAEHVMLYEGDHLAAYARVFKKGIKYDAASIGRVITSTQYRGKGLGIPLMEASIQTLLMQGEDHIKLSSQAYAEGFYEKVGFKRTEKAPYLEDDIPHVEMEYKGAWHRDQ